MQVIGIANRCRKQRRQQDTPSVFAKLRKGIAIFGSITVGAVLDHDERVPVRVAREPIWNVQAVAETLIDARCEKRRRAFTVKISGFNKNVHGTLSSRSPFGREPYVRRYVTLSAQAVRLPNNR